MIVEMCRVRILGPARHDAAVVSALQDFARVQLVPSPREPPAQLSREERLLRRVLSDVEAALGALAPESSRTGPAPLQRRFMSADILRFARLGRRVRRTVERLDAEIAAAEDERGLLTKYRALFAMYGPLLEGQARWPDLAAYHVMLDRPDRSAVARLREALAALVGEAFHLREHPLETGELAILILLPRARAQHIERALSNARVREIPIPSTYGKGALAEAIPQMIARLDEIPRVLRAAVEERARLRQEHGPSLHDARAAIADRLAALEAIRQTGRTPHAFVIDGWVPAALRDDLAEHLRAAAGAPIAVETIPRDAWGDDEPPVELANARVLRPFEALLRPLQLPRYGTVDPTPLLAVFFPTFFGLMLGDVGYGAVLLALGLALRVRARQGSARRVIGSIACVCAASGVVFGLLFGELFGDLGHRLIGLHPLLFDRAKKIETLLAVSMGIGFFHVLFGLVLGTISAARRDKRHGAARGISAAMVVLTMVAILAGAAVLPDALLVPALLGLAVAGVGLVATSGIVGPVELISTLCNVLSYTRLMALGAASVTLALVANEVGSGGVVAGVIAAILLHLVNFVIGVFSPTIHALRLQYVEFFGKFFEPGGVRFRPFAHFNHE